MACWLAACTLLLMCFLAGDNAFASTARHPHSGKSAAYSPPFDDDSIYARERPSNSVDVKRHKTSLISRTTFDPQQHAVLAALYEHCHRKQTGTASELEESYSALLQALAYSPRAPPAI